MVQKYVCAVSVFFIATQVAGLCDNSLKRALVTRQTCWEEDQGNRTVVMADDAREFEQFLQPFVDHYFEGQEDPLLPYNAVLGIKGHKVIMPAWQPAALCFIRGAQRVDQNNMERIKSIIKPSLNVNLPCGEVDLFSSGNNKKVWLTALESFVCMKHWTQWSYYRTRIKKLLKFIIKERGAQVEPLTYQIIQKFGFGSKKVRLAMARRIKKWDQERKLSVLALGFKKGEPYTDCCVSCCA